MLSLSSQPLLISDSQFSVLKAKSFKKWNFYLSEETVIWMENYILLVTTSPSMCSVSKIEPRKHIYQDGTQNSAKRLTSKNELSNRSSFSDSEIVNWLVTLKGVEKWSQILTLSPDWPCTQNETTLIDNSASKSLIFKTLPTISNIYHFEVFFATINNMLSLPSNSPLFSLDPTPKFCIARKTRIFLRTFNGRSGYDWKCEFKSSWLQVESRWSNGQISENLAGKTLAIVGLFCPPSVTAARLALPLSASKFRLPLVKMWRHVYSFDARKKVNNKRQ